MPQYLMSVWHDDEYEVDFSSDEAQRRVALVSALNDDLQRTGVWVFGAGLQPKSSATVIELTAAGELSMTDGPYAESKEQMGGFYVIDVPDLDAALEWTRKAAAACGGPIELRPMQG